MVKSVEHFHKYVYGKKLWLLRCKNPEGQVEKWIEHTRVQEKYFDSEDRSGSKHWNADALLRRPCSEDCAHCDRMEKKSNIVYDRVTVVYEEWNKDEDRADQESDDSLKYVLEWKRNGMKPI